MKVLKSSKEIRKPVMKLLKLVKEILTFTDRNPETMIKILNFSMKILKILKSLEGILKS